jgi:hypothetical protein
VPDEWVKVVGLFQVAPENVNEPAACGAIRVPAEVNRFPFISNVYVVVAVPNDPPEFIVVVPFMVLVPVDVVTAPLVPLPITRFPPTVMLYVDIASVAPLFTVTELNWIELFPSVVVPAILNVTVPELLVYVVGVFHVAPAKVNDPEAFGALNVPAELASVPSKSRV